MAQIHSIADVERDTGLGKDTLRAWERRYGFPKPVRDSLGERAYAPAEVEKLRIIKRLLDAGHRPARLVSRSLEELQALGDAAPLSPPVGDTSTDDLRAAMTLLRRHDATALQRHLTVVQARHGLRAFVLDTLAPLAHAVGDAWMRGQLRIFEEHLFTECAQTTLRTALAGMPAPEGPPRVLLATLPGEPHGLGLLMAQAMLALAGCACLSLGVQVPLADIAAASVSWRADIVALSVSGCAKRTLLVDSLAQLRGALPDTVALWVGGSATALSRRPLSGVTRVPTLQAIDEALRPWRKTAS